MTNSEKLLSFFSENYFYKELVYADLKFTPTGGTEVELADLIINLEDIILAIQLKEGVCITSLSFVEYGFFLAHNTDVVVDAGTDKYKEANNRAYYFWKVMEIWSLVSLYLPSLNKI